MFVTVARVLTILMLLCIAIDGALAVGLDQTPSTTSAKIALSTARSACISESKPVPRWTGKAHPRCSVEWSELGKKGRLVLYRARYKWPSEELPNKDYSVVTEVLFEGIRRGKQVMPLFAIQNDETYEFLSPLSLHRVGDRMVVKIEICLNGTGGCDQDFLLWQPGKTVEISNSIHVQVEQQLPAGYSILKSPQIDIDTLTGVSGAWLESDPNASPSASVTFSLSLSGHNLLIRDFRFQKNRGQ